MIFTVKFKDDSELTADMVQESIRSDALTGECEKRLIIQYSSGQQDDIDNITDMLMKPHNLEQISVYDGDEKVALYEGYTKIESISRTLQSTVPNKKFILDIQLVK